MTTRLPPDRHFGLVFTALFAGLAVLSYLRGGHAFVWLLPLGALTGLVALISPRWLRPFNRLWMKLAALLHAIVSPVVLAVLYFLILTPFGFVQRLAGRDTMRQRIDPRIDSYWISREPPGPPPESLRNQFQEPQLFADLQECPQLYEKWHQRPPRIGSEGFPAEDPAVLGISNTNRFADRFAAASYPAPPTSGRNRMA